MPCQSCFLLSSQFAASCLGLFKGGKNKSVHFIGKSSKLAKALRQLPCQQLAVPSEHVSACVGQILQHPSAVSALSTTPQHPLGPERTPTVSAPP